jgi:hypothetical protein
MFSVEFTLGRRRKSGSPSSAGPAERLSCERGDAAIDRQIDTKRRSVLGCWVRSMATLRRLNNVPSEAPQLDRS